VDDIGGVFGKTQLTPHEQARLFKIPLQLLMSASVDPEALFLDWYTRYQAIIEENAFLNGNGKDKPLGLLFRDGSGNYARGMQTVTATAPGASDPNYGLAISAGDIFKLIYAIRAVYRATGRCVFMIPRQGISQIRQLKSTTGQFLWSEGNMITGQPPTLAGYPVIETEYFPAQNGFGVSPITPATGDPMMLFGDLSHYWIADGPAMRVLRLNELFAQSRQVGFLMTKWTDGAPILGEAFSVLTHA
jgi:HK97 family phage major capsid protein